MRKILIAVLTGATALFMGVSPILAVSVAESPDNGSTAACRFKTTDGDSFAGHAKLRKIVVTPPTMFAKSGHQTVGWRFEVSRTYGSDPAKITYRSPIETAMATTTSPAAFNDKSVEVSLPNVEEPGWLVYRVTLKMTWYRSNRSVQSKTSYPMPTYRLHYNGEWDEGYSTCGAIVRWGP